jgi:hypothetical protein
MRFPCSLEPVTRMRPTRAVAAAAAICAAMMLAGCTSAGSAASPAPAAAQSDSLAADPQVRDVLVNSCFDCHGNQGSGSFSAGKAREALNFSDWSAMDPKQQREAAAEVAKVIESGSMPPGDYDFFHPSAELSSDQKQLIAQWAAHQEAVPAH